MKLGASALPLFLSTTSIVKDTDDLPVPNVTPSKKISGSISTGTGVGVSTGVSTGGVSTNVSQMAYARVVLAPPCAVWHDGVVAVTGHDSGLVCFWRLQQVPLSPSGSVSGPGSNEDKSKSNSEGRSEGKSKSGRRQLVPYPLSLSPAQSATQMPSQFQTQQQTQKRSQTHIYTHNAPITTLRLCPIIYSKSKDLADKISQGGPMDLLVGDEKGFVSAWTLMKLDQFSSIELSTMHSLKPPPPKEIPHTTSSSSTNVLTGGGNVFVPLGPLGAASGLLKFIGATVLVSSVHSSAPVRQHETASALAARIQEIEDLSNDDNMEEFF